MNPHAWKGARPSLVVPVIACTCLVASGCGSTGAVRATTAQAGATVTSRVPEGADRPHFSSDLAELEVSPERISLPERSARAMRQPDTGAACPMGTPVPRPGLDFGPTETVMRAGYRLLHSADLKTPYWVCETYTTTSLQSNHERGGLKFKADPELQLAHAVPADYAGSSRYVTADGDLFPIDIGHMAPAEAHSSTESLLRDTFFLSNAVPQHRAMNRGQWARLEACARTTGPVRDPKWVISGPMIYSDENVSEIEVDTIGNGVVIPTHTWKIMVYRSPDGTLGAWAAVIPNDKLPDGSQLSDFVASIDDIEDATGFDFLPDLEASEQPALERTKHAIPCQ